MLAELITRIDNWQDLTASQILDLLSAATELYVDDRRWTLLQIADVVGKENMDGMIAILKQNGLEWAVIQAGGSGMPLGHQEVNKTLRELGDARFETLANETRRMISPLEKAGLSATLSDVAQTVGSLLRKSNQDALIATEAPRWNQFVEAVANWDGISTPPVL